ncbi:GGDEF domain-containing protein [Treponema sp.]|uniref:GGDEF domain-containing protein n=1 Tax=Treponema sp. TaxID=166 RepID=UPI003EFD461A
MQKISEDSIRQFMMMQESGLLHSFEQLKKENEQFQRTIKDMSALVTCTNIDSMVKFIISRFIDYFVPESLVFMIKKPRSSEIIQYYYEQLKKSEECLVEELFYSLKDFFDANSSYYMSGEAVPVEKLADSMSDEVFSTKSFSINPKYIIPLIGIGGTCGIVIFGNKIIGGHYDTAELFYLKNMFSVFAISLQNEMNYKTSITDPKTGLYTYDYFVKRIQEKIAKARRYNSTSAILMLDIDHFKKFNDTYGHLVGDKVLVELAKTLVDSLREEDCVGRFGGEEFVVLLSECKPDSIFKVSERIRASVEQMEIFENGQRLKVTVSIGGSKILPDPDESPKSVIKRIDDALYQSKANGRNRSTIV